LCILPFEKNSWDRAARLLGENEGDYWNNTSVNTYQTEEDTEYALRKLPDKPIQFERVYLGRCQHFLEEL
jgi:hypothetical protein